MSLSKLRRLIGNIDAYAEQHSDGTWTPIRHQLTDHGLHQHIAGNHTYGTYVVSPPDQARTLVIDLDSGDYSLADAEDVRWVLQELGIPDRAIGIEFSGNKGHHVWVVCSAYVPAEWLYRLGRAAVAMAGVEAEVFPKQTEVREGGLGNLVKLPYGVHQVTGNKTEFIKDWQVLSKSVLERVVDGLPVLSVARGSSAAPALTCMAEIQKGIEDGWRNNGLFHFSTMLHRAGLDHDIVGENVRTVNARCVPPLDEEEVEQLIESSQHSGPICTQLPNAVRCENCPILSNKGLYTKPNQISHGSEGELAVVKVGKRRSGGIVEIEHPDLENGLVKVRE